MGIDPGVLKLADPPLARANGLRHRSLGGKRGPGDSPLVKTAAAVRRWPKASFYKGTIARLRSATEGDDRVRLVQGCGGGDPAERERGGSQK